MRKCSKWGPRAIPLYDLTDRRGMKKILVPGSGRKISLGQNCISGG